MTYEMTSAERRDYNVAAFEASYYSVTTSYKIMGPLSEANSLEVVYLVMRDRQGNCIEVPCTYVVAGIIRRYGSGVKLVLYISPRVKADNLIPLVIGAVPAV